MVSINSRLNKIFLKVDVSSSFCDIYDADSGIGKSYYLDLLAKELEKEGKRTDHIMYSTRKMVGRICDYDEHLFLIILDELELYHNEIDLSKVRSHCDNLWILSRCFIGHSYCELPIIFFEVNDNEVYFHEEHCSF